jgi:hypothetical protein
VTGNDRYREPKSRSPIGTAGAVYCLCVRPTWRVPFGRGAIKYLQQETGLIHA